MFFIFVAILQYVKIDSNIRASVELDYNCSRETDDEWNREGDVR